MDTKSIIAEAAIELKKLLANEHLYLSDDEATEQTISLLNLFGALTETGKEREDEA